MPDDSTPRDNDLHHSPGGDGFSYSRAAGAGADVLGPAIDSGVEFNPGQYLRLAIKHRFLILGIVIGALLIGVSLTLLTTPTYTATATIQIDREAARVLDTEGTAPAESMIQGVEFFETQYGLMRSRSLAERVIESLGLASSDQFLEQMGVTPPRLVAGSASDQLALRRKLVLSTVQANLTVVPVRGSRLAMISFRSPTPGLSARVANAFAQNYIQSNLDRKFESTAYIRQFLEERIAQTKSKLEDAERDLVAYAAGQQIVTITESTETGAPSQSLASNNLVSLNAALAEARAGRVSAEEKWRQAQVSPLMAMPEVLQNPAIQRLSEDRAKLEAEYQQKLAVYQPDFPEMLQLKARIDELQSQISSLAGSIRASIRGQYVVATNEEQSLRRQVAALTDEVLDLRDRSVEYNILQREVDTSRTLYDGLLQRYKEVGVTGGVTSNNISMVDEADLPNEPSSPKLLLNLAVALLLGLGLGVLAVLLIEALDETLATPDDVESKLGIPVLGVSPLLAKGDSPGTALTDIRSAFSEAYYSLRTALQFSTPDGTPSSLLVSSARPAEGKSTTAYAVALNLARVGKRVLLVDGDLRNPSMHRVVDAENERGMSNLLSGSADLVAVVQQTSHENLSFIPCGPLPPNPAELWGGDRFRQFLADARNHFDHVVVDGPPVLGLADAPMLAARVGGVLFVLESRGTRRGQARGALRRLQVGRAHLLGAVLTKFSAKSTSYGGYDYAYDYHYGADPDAKASSKKVLGT